MPASIKLVSYNKQVYSPSEDSFALVDAIVSASDELKRLRPAIGYVVCSLALLLQQLGVVAHILATDISAAATTATSETLAAHKVQSVDVIQTDLIQSLEPQLIGQVDLLLFNPPYVPSPVEELSRTDIARAWAGGIEGRQVIDRVLGKLGDWLSPTGRMYMVTISQNNPQGIIRQMQSAGIKGAIVHTIQADEELLQIVCLSRTLEE